MSPAHRSSRLRVGELRPCRPVANQISPPRSKKGLPIDPSYTTADGEDFAGINQFRAIVLKRPEKIARNVVEHMLTYGTGAPISFADREVVEQIVERSADKNYGFRTLIEEAVSSQIFLTK